MPTDPDGQGLAVVTATAPTPNGPLHLGHLSGPYVAADAAARAARARGRQVLTMSGLDPNQNYVPAKAALEGRAPDEMLDEYEELIRQVLSAARVRYDIFTDPRADVRYRDAVSGLLDGLITEKAAVIKEVTLVRCAGCRATLHHAYVTGECPVCGVGAGGGTCEGCGAFTTGSNLRGAHCARCGGAAEPFQAEIPLLRLESYRAALTQTWASAVLPARVRALISHYLTVGLPDVPLAYPTDWGIPAGDGSQRIDVWAEMGLGLLAAVAKRLSPAASTPEDYLAAWQQVGECWHFLGIDNAFYFGVLFPAILTGAGVPAGWLGGLVVNEFYRLDGLKFSTSRNHAVWAHEFLADEDPAVLRLFLCLDRPDRYESDFTRQAYAEFRDWIGPALHSGGHIPSSLAGAELARAEHALSFAGFDPSLALHCLLGAGQAGRRTFSRRSAARRSPEPPPHHSRRPSAPAASERRAPPHMAPTPRTREDRACLRPEGRNVCPRVSIRPRGVGDDEPGSSVFSCCWGWRRAGEPEPGRALRGRGTRPGRAFRGSGRADVARRPALPGRPHADRMV